MRRRGSAVVQVQVVQVVLITDYTIVSQVLLISCSSTLADAKADA